MTWISKSITTFGLVLLAHACYSAHEHSALHSTGAPSAAATSPTAGRASPATAAATTSLPIDISIETVTALLIICLGLVLGTPHLRPIQWREWAGKIEREGDKEGDKDYVGNPYRFLESRPGFVNIRKQRKDFAQWVKSGNHGAKA
ncbi:hypothetical protein MCOR25_006874 [Pyricularia grisea]|nr:hypothetical protein MCOR25_006874 [Pyricularia grisea]